MLREHMVLFEMTSSSRQFPTMFLEQIDNPSKVEPCQYRKKFLFRNSLFVVNDARHGEEINFPSVFIHSETIIDVLRTIENIFIEQAYAIHSLPPNKLASADDIVYFTNIRAVPLRHLMVFQKGVITNPWNK